MKTIEIGKWKVPEELFDEYIKFRMLSDKYLSGTVDVPSNTEYERSMRWQLCVKKVMEIHREICEKLGIEYTTDDTDEFYIAFQKEVRKQTKLKG